ncbi:MAG: hypothetical protein KC621_08040 [Myxococcales bacterium]|nr:hypothetical protein [Myxococcales bacterium]
MADITTTPALAGLYEAPTTATTAGSTELGEDAFLRLLTTQLQYQDPSSPVKNEDFVAQLAQFSSLEQLTGLNATLEGVYVALAAMNNASMASLVGTDVIARGDRFQYGGEGPVELHYDAPTDLVSATLTVYDEDGHVVYSGDAGQVTSGEGTLMWSGEDSNGQPLPEGEYRFAINGYDSEGNPIDVSERIAGTITEMDYSTGAPKPAVEGVPIELGDILTLTAGGAP